MDFKNKSLRDNFSKMSNVEKEQKHITFIKSYTKTYQTIIISCYILIK